MGFGERDVKQAPTKLHDFIVVITINLLAVHDVSSRFLEARIFKAD